MNGDFINVSIIYFLEYNHFTNRAMRLLLLILLIILLSNCSSIELAKEVTKATKSIKASVDNIIENNGNAEKEEVVEEATDDKQTINQKVANLKKEKKAKENTIKEQKKKTKINFLDKTSDEIKLIIGDPKLIRIDGNSKIVRFDNKFCQLFLFLNAKSKKDKIRYFEIRNKKGQLIINKLKIEKCYKNFKLI